MIKGLLFSLFLYLCLVWVGAAYLHPESPGFAQFGLFWTAVGLIVLLAWIILARIWNWWRLWRARARSKPVAPPNPVQTVHEDDLALQSLIDEANAALTKAARRSDGQNRISDFPVYLLIGPEGSGKTSTFLNAEMEPQLLAGQVSGTAALVPTRLCNIWLARKVVFVEFSGRAFSGDIVRWKQLLKVLRGGSARPVWQRFLKDADQRVTPRGVVAFSHCSHFSADQHGRNPERYSRDWQDRLRGISEVFEEDCAIFQIVTHADSIQFFTDFFLRIPEAEANQVLGCTLPLRLPDGRDTGEIYAEAETKRLTKFFNELYRSLAGRRVTHLTHEPDPAKRPAVYEFPREFKRIRTPLIQFLIDAFRPNPLQHGPLLRGFYLTGIRHVEAAAAADNSKSQQDWSVVNAGAEATRLFRGDVTQMFRPTDLGTGVQSVAAKQPVAEWVFTSDLFNRLILVDRPVSPRPIRSPRIERYRQFAVASACALSLLLCVAFFASWSNNRAFLNEVERVSWPRSLSQGNGTATAADLESLETLRAQLAQLTTCERQGPPLGMRWGLYAGNSILPQVKDSYFRAFRRLILIPANATLVSRLNALPPNPGANDAYAPAYQSLKTHISISSGACKPDPASIASTLKEALPPIGGEDPRLTVLANRQIDFYAGELEFGNPSPVKEDIPARDRGREYLRNIRGVERIYVAVLGKARTSLNNPQKLTEFAGNYTQVLNGPSEVDPVFSRQGWSIVQRVAKEGGTESAGEACVVGESSRIFPLQDSETQRAIERLYVRDYINAWRKFLSGFSVVRYSGPADAARKLEMLSGHRSPLLAVLFMTSKQTSFPPPSSAPEGIAKIPSYIGKLTGSQKAETAAASALPGPGNAGEAVRVADITNTFQPVQWALPADGDLFVVDRNKGYVDALAQLQHSMDEIALTTIRPDPAIYQTAMQNYEKALESVRQIARGFKSIGVNGVDGTVQALLEQPIKLTRVFIIDDLSEAGAAAINKEAKRVCAEINRTTSKYPFRPSTQDSTVEEIAGVFSPGTGEIWKFQAGSLADYALREGGQWKVKDPAKKPQITDTMLTFLNRAQAVTDSFFASGPQPHLNFTFRPKLDSAYKDAFLELEVDGNLHQWKTVLQQSFTWPPPTGAKPGAVARIRLPSGVVIPVASRGGLWSVFRIIGDAEPRPLSAKIVEWKELKGGDGRREPIEPPVRMEIVEFPAGVDLFNPKFFDGLQCPGAAVK